MFNETAFIENFVKYYLDNSNYAYDETSMLYDDYIEEVVSSNSQEINEYIINKYDNPTNVDVNSNIKDRVAEILSDRFYNQAEEALRNRFKAIRQMMSVMKGIIVDADKEQVDFITRQFAGVADIMDRFTQRLVGATDLPYTYIFGRGQAGLNAQGTGDAEDKMMAKKTSQFQEDVFRPRFQYLGELIWLAKDGPTKGKLPEDWGFHFKSLIEETNTEKIAARLQAAQAYNTYVSMGVLLPEEVRNSQFGGDEYSIEINLDEKLWKQKQEEQAGGGFGDFGGFGGGGDLGGEGGFGSGTETVPEDEQQDQIAQEEQNQEEAAPKQDSFKGDYEKWCREEARSLTKKRFVLDSVVARVWEKNKYKELLENGTTV